MCLDMSKTTSGCSDETPLLLLRASWRDWELLAARVAPAARDILEAPAATPFFRTDLTVPHTVGVAQGLDHANAGPARGLGVIHEDHIDRPAAKCPICVAILRRMAPAGPRHAGPPA